MGNNNIYVLQVKRFVEGRDITNLYLSKDCYDNYSEAVSFLMDNNYKEKHENNEILFVHTNERGFVTEVRIQTLNLIKIKS